MQFYDLNSFEATMLVNDRDSKETVMMKKLCSDEETKPLQNCMQQHALRNVFKHRLLSETKNEESIQKRVCR